MRLFAEIKEIKDKHVIRITETQMFDLILEAASIQDIYQKYYSNIPQDVFQQIISADPTYNTQKPDKMGKFGKWLLAIYMKGNLKTEDMYKATQYLQTFIKFNAKIEQKDVMKYKSLSELYNVVEPFISNPQQAASKSEEVRNIKQDAEKVYEDEKWMVIVPHTQEASCYYGKGTQWCTAANDSYNYFDEYNKRGLLYINILKDTNTKYQFHFETASYMDATDTEIEHPVAETIGLTDGLTKFYIQIYGKNAVIDLTTEMNTKQTEHVTNLPDYYVYDDGAKLMKYNKDKKEFDNIYAVNDYHKQIQNFDICKRFIPICEDDFYINLFDTQYDTLLFDDEDEIDTIRFMSNKGLYDSEYEYAVINYKDETQRTFSLNDLKYTSENFSNEYQFSSSLCSRANFKHYNSDLAMVCHVKDYGNTVLGYGIYSLSQGKMLTDFYKKTRKDFFYCNINGKPTPLAFEILYNKPHDYQEAMLVMYDGKLYPLIEFSQKTDQIVSEFFTNNTNGN